MHTTTCESHPLQRPAAPRPSRSAFTLIELLVVIAIIALLVSILLPTLTQAKRLAVISTCMVTLRSHGTSIAMYTVENEDVYPTPFDLADGRHNHSGQYRYYWQVIQPRYFDPSRDIEVGGVDLGYICPGYRNVYEDVQLRGWQYKPHIVGFQSNFANLAAETTYSNQWRFRSLGSVRSADIGSRADSTVGADGAALVTNPSRMIALCDAGFNNALVPDLEAFGHEDGWSALLTDGHAAFFELANEPTDWDRKYQLIPEL